jgi:anti-sigma regulatory factor (Ser/Thr protein kinase)
MARTDAPLEDSLSEVPLDSRTHLIRVRGDASLVARELRSAASAAVAAGRTGLVIDLLAATQVHGPLAWELSRAHERLLWRAGRVVVVSEYSGLESLFDAFGLHRSPDVVLTLDAGLAAVNVSKAGMAVAHGSAFESAPAPTSGPPGLGAGASEPQPFAWRRHESVPASWSFELPGGREAPGIARAAAGRVLTGRLDDATRHEALLLVSEAVTNSVQHGAATDREPIELTVTVTGDKVRVEIADPAGGFEPPEYPTDELRLSGRGLPIIHSLAQSWGVENAPGGALWFELECAAA